MLPTPHEISIGGVFLPPLLVAVVAALVLTSASIRVMDHYRMARHVFYPPAVTLALFVIYTVFIGTFFVGI